MISRRVFTCACAHLRNQFDNFTTLKRIRLCLRFSSLSRFYSIYIFIRCSSSRAVAVVPVIIAAACLCMLENNANACTRLIAIATSGVSEREREREKGERTNQFLITKKRQVHDREKAQEQTEVIKYKARNIRFEPYRSF